MVLLTSDAILVMDGISINCVLSIKVCIIGSWVCIYKDQMENLDRVYIAMAYVIWIAFLVMKCMCIWYLLQIITKKNIYYKETLVSNNEISFALIISQCFKENNRCGNLF